ncbi:MAG: SPFH domain-containing protein, partial [Ignavibacteriaceae bacterium]|nr:SPFH domain-containing protein [Ignavibacteriaceae bacterium]
MENIVEKPANKINGFLMLFLSIVLLAIDIYLLVLGIKTDNLQILWIFIPLSLIAILILAGFMAVQPNDSRVLILFGKYTGTVRHSGFWWVNPFTIRKKVSLRIRNFNSQKIKVNDL